MSPSVLDQQKIFCIGFQKTGTQSVATSLGELGYRVTGPRGFRIGRIRRFYRQLCADLSYQFDAFQGDPWPIVYQDMFALWPNAKFVLTVRDKHEWIDSVLNDHAGTKTPMRGLVFGSPDPLGNEQVYLDRFERHNDEVQEFFANRSEQLLTMDLTKGDGYEKLCPFMGKPLMSRLFPHENIGAQNALLQEPVAV